MKTALEIEVEEKMNLLIRNLKKLQIPTKDILYLLFIAYLSDKELPYIEEKDKYYLLSTIYEYSKYYDKESIIYHIEDSLKFFDKDNLLDYQNIEWFKGVSKDNICKALYKISELDLYEEELHIGLKYIFNELEEDVLSDISYIYNYYIPKEIQSLMGNLLVNNKSTKDKIKVFDPHCYMGSLLLETTKHLKKAKLIGIEPIIELLNLAKMKMIINKVTKFKLSYKYDQDLFKTEKYDYIITNSLLKKSSSDSIREGLDRLIYSGTMIALEEMDVLLNKYIKELGLEYLEEHLYAVIILNDRLIHTINTPCIMVLKETKCTNNVFFMDARKCFTTDYFSINNLNRLRQNDIEYILNSYNLREKRFLINIKDLENNLCNNS